MSEERKNSAQDPVKAVSELEQASAQNEEAVKMSEQIEKTDTEKEPEQVSETGAETGPETVREPAYSEDAYAEAEKYIEPEQVVKSGKKAAAKKKIKAAGEPEKRTIKKKQPEQPERTKEPEQNAPRFLGALLRKMIFCVSLGVFSYALAGLAVLLWGYYSSQKEYDKINEDAVVIGTTSALENQEQNSDDVVVELPEDGETKAKAPYLDIQVDEHKLRALNQDYAFYIVIPDTHIQYPVVQGEDNNHYLRYTYSNQENTAGAIALDYRTDRSTYLQSFNTIISGHNRQDGTMFSDLAYYKEEDFRDDHPYIYIVMGDEEYVYEVFSFYAMEPVAVCYNPNTADNVYLDFVNDNNTYHNDINVTLEDHIITLYTCNEDSSMRYLCHAVLREVYELN